METKETVFELLKDSILSKPRMMGTPAEKETTRFLVETMKNFNLTPKTENFEWSIAAVMGRKYLIILLGVFLLGFNLTIRIEPPLNAWLTLGFVIFSILLIVFLMNRLMADKLKFLGKTFTGQNVVCDIQSKTKNENPYIIYLTAHTDSVASNFASISTFLLIGILVGSLVSIILSITAGAISLTAFYNQAETTTTLSIVNTINLIAACLTLLLTVINLLGKRVNTSPGACDNGSGSAILLKLAEHFQQFPTDNITLKFLWCAGEEWGLYGSKGYVKAHKQEIKSNSERSAVINVDMVGTELSYLERSGLFRKPLNKKLNQIIAQTAKEKNIETRPFYSIMSSNSDHAPFQKEKVEVCFFMAKKDSKRIHSPKDTIEEVNPQKLEDAVELIKSMIIKLDREEDKN